MEYLFYFLVFALGAIVGSFLNVVILRYNTGDSPLKGRSRCFSCGKELSWYELIPIFSFIIQKKKCRGCGSKISWQYPLVETVTGLLFLLIFKQFSNLSILELVYMWTIASLLIVIAVYDLRHFIVPNLFVWLFNGLAFLFVLFEILPVGRQVFDLLVPSVVEGEFISDLGFRILNFWPNFFAGLSFAAFFAFLWAVSNGKWIGFGDAKLALGLGWILGPAGAISAFLISFWTGAFLSLILLLFWKSKFTIKSKVPFTPFLILGFLIAFLFKIDIINIFNLFYVF